MDESDDTRRTIAACEQCGSLYAALEISTAEFRPIGRRNGCECGSMDFTPVDGDVSDLELDEDPTDD